MWPESGTQRGDGRERPGRKEYAENPAGLARPTGIEPVFLP